jgi:hypothetical protein
MEDDEMLVLVSLANAWAEFIKLPVQHPDDRTEFRHKIHELQCLVMARKAVRDCPDIFYRQKEN